MTPEITELHIQDMQWLANVCIVAVFSALFLLCVASAKAKKVALIDDDKNPSLVAHKAGTGKF